uniref:Uncharacterized protein n=1 Tax=Trichuris muris TaxID=70415 RepID=A0A5S6QQR7_TRIMR
MESSFHRPSVHTSDRRIRAGRNRLVKHKEERKHGHTNLYDSTFPKRRDQKDKRPKPKKVEERKSEAWKLKSSISETIINT